MAAEDLGVEDRVGKRGDRLGEGDSGVELGEVSVT